MTKSVNTLVAATARMVRDLLLPAAAVLLMSGCGGGGGDSGAGASTPTAVAPSITTQPADQSVTAGQPASFSVAASGTGPLSYQWLRNAAAIAGATGATYGIASATTADSGATFTVVVSNSAGSVTSNAATLAVSVAATVVSSASGGQVTSDDGKVILTIPANALTADSTVTIAPTTDWTVPSALAGQFTVVAGTTHVISARGGSFDAAKRFEVAVSTAGVLALAQRSKRNAAGMRIARAKNSGSGSNSNGNLGLVEDCGDGNPIIIIVPPSQGEFMGTSLAGCPVGTSGGTTVSVVTWTPPSSTPTPSGNVIWDTRAPLTYTPSPNTTSTYVRGDSWLGATPASIAANSVGTTVINPSSGTNQLEESLITLVDGNGQLIAQELLPVKMNTIVLDGPANFYIALGPDGSFASYVSRYALQFSAQGAPSFVKLWESTITGAPATGDGNDINFDRTIGGVEQSAVGTNFAVDPITGDLVVLAGNASKSGKLSADEISRLGFEADGFVVRLSRAGALATATPVVPTQQLSAGGTPLLATRVESFALRVDHAGNSYVASVGCCDATGQNSYGVSGLTVKKIDPSGRVVWEAPVASPDEASLFTASYPSGFELAIDRDNNAILTYYQNNYANTVPNGAHLVVVKIAADSGSVGSLGYVDKAVDKAGYYIGPGVGNVVGSSYMDDSGILYITVDLRGRHLLALDSATLALLGSTDLADPPLGAGSGCQVDALGNIYKQAVIQNGLDSNHRVYVVVDLQKLHL